MRLTQGTFILSSGRLGDVYGHRDLLFAGGAWLSLTTLASAFCNHSFFALITTRALGGLGGASILLNAVAMISSTNPPGHLRNLSLGFFAASEPIVGYFGALFLGAFMETIEWKWLFVFMLVRVLISNSETLLCSSLALPSAGTGVITFLAIWALSSYETPVNSHGKIDIVGSALGVSSLIFFLILSGSKSGCISQLFCYYVNQAHCNKFSQFPSVGWQTPYGYCPPTSIHHSLRCIPHLEKRYTAYPIMPLDIFKALCLLIVILVIFLNYMAVGTLIWYQVL